MSEARSRPGDQIRARTATVTGVIGARVCYNKFSTMVKRMIVSEI
jgi:hypothetical protein